MKNAERLPTIEKNNEGSSIQTARMPITATARIDNGYTYHGFCSFDLRLSNKAWVEAERYRFLEFVSSQSTMHRISRFDLDTAYNSWVDNRIIQVVKEKVERYNRLKANEPDVSLPEYQQELKDAYLEILYNNPAGFELTARMATNYRCILNIINQRWNHRLPEWREVCREFINELPLMEDLVKVYAPSVDIEQLMGEEYHG